MALNVLIVAILALVIGLAFCFAGYRFFRLLIAIWGFFAGFMLASQAVAASAGGHILISVIGVVIAVIVGLIVAALAYYLYVAAVAILGASVGFWIGTGLMTALGFSSQSAPALLVGIIVAVVLVLIILAWNLTKLLIIISTSLGGASTAIAGVLLLLRIIPLDALTVGVIGAIIRGSPIWSLVWLALAVVGIIVQLSSTRRYDQGYAHSQFS
ncbi:MAG TPA: DUF4203 domain-containing protein [Ktedonobacteraceae bacterium]|nr:DUF4203 domain-containing protein [Ktedonobacteraceae bacterium]